MNSNDIHRVYGIRPVGVFNQTDDDANEDFSFVPSTLIQFFGDDVTDEFLDLFKFEHTTAGCGHDYDCCGCVSQRVRVHKSGGYVFVKISRTANY